MFIFILFQMFLGKLFIPRKNQRQVQQPDYGTDMRAIETYINNLPPTPPTFYASLTGPGETSTPGALTQSGPLTVTGGSINGNLNGNVSNSGLTITNTGTAMQIQDQSGGNSSWFSPTGSIEIWCGATTFASATTSIQLTTSGAVNILCENSGNINVYAVSGGIFSANSNGASISGRNSGGASVITFFSGLIQITSNNSQSVAISSGNLVTTSSAFGTQIETSSSGLVGFYGTTPHTRGTVTGSRGGNAALANLLTILANNGLIVDSSTP